jgi:hypothetical protein
VVKKGLQENGAKPVRREKTQYDHFEKFCILQGTGIYMLIAPAPTTGGIATNRPATVFFGICQ